MRKKLLSLLLVLSMLLALMPITAAADTPITTPITQTTATITKSETDTTYNFDVVAANTYANCYVYAAIYAYNNTLLEVKRVPLETTGNTSVSVGKSPYNALVKVFIWSENMQPIIEAEEFSLTPTATMTPKPTAKPTPKPTPTPTPKPTATPTPKPAKDFAWTLDEATGTLTISGHGAMKDYDYYSVPWYNKCDSIKSVIIEKGITSIGTSAFSGCSNLTDVYYNGTFTDFAKISIGDYNTPLTNAKLHCNNITLDNWGKCGDTVAYYLDEATGTLIINGKGNMADYGYYSAPWYDEVDKIKSISIESSITHIGSFAFFDCGGLTEVVIPYGIASIGGNAFRVCRGLTDITIPASVTSIGGQAFAFCDNLDSLYITDLAAYLNIDCPSEDWEDDSNPMCSAKKLYLNNKRIAGAVKIPDGVTKICRYAFNGCDGITSISIPNSVTSIDKDAFSNCISLKDIYITDLAAWCNIKFDSTPMSYADNLYLNNELVTNLVIPDEVTSIGNYAFSNCGSLTSVTIPASVTSIGNYAFSNCISLKDIYITDLAAWCNIKFSEYYSNPMCYASNLYLNNILVTDLVIPNEVTSIGDYKFYGCSRLRSVTIPDSVTSIGNYAFSRCGSLTSVTIPDSVTSIGDSAFSSCSSLTSVTIGNGITNIDSNVFNYCSSLTEIVIPKSVTEIESGAFENCLKLTTVKYCGSEAEWNEMYIGSNNDYLKNANIIFDYVAE